MADDTEDPPPVPAPRLVAFQPKKGYKTLSIRDLYSEPDPEVEWFWDSWLPTQAFVCLAGSPKSGKSTFLYALLAAIAKGSPFLDRTTRKAKILVLGLEESKREIRRHCRDNGISYNDPITLCTERVLDYNEYLSNLRAMIQQDGYDLVVVDTLSRLWQIQNENDNAEAARKLSPLHAICRDEKVTILVVHHTRKEHFQQKENTHGDMRGAQALRAEFDVNLVYGRFGPSTLRKLKYEGRVSTDTPVDMVIDMEAPGEFTLESGGSYTFEDKKASEVLKYVTLNPGVTVNKIIQGVKGKRTRLIDIIKKLVDTGQLYRDPEKQLLSIPKDDLEDPDGLEHDGWIHSDYDHDEPA